MLQKQANLISNALKCVGGWGSTPNRAGGAYDAPPNPLIVRGNPSHHKFLATPLMRTFSKLLRA